MRKAEIFRDTKETKISFKMNIDGSGKADISTGIAFLDHMLQLLQSMAFSICRSKRRVTWKWIIII